MTLKELSRRRFLKSASGLLLVPAFDIFVPKLKATSFFAVAAAGGGSDPLAHDAITESSTFGATPDPFTFTHTPVGTPRAVILLLGHNLEITDLFDAAPTYGGVSFGTRVAVAVSNTGEPGATYAYHLGSSIPTGMQTISIPHTASATLKIAYCITMTAPGDTVVAAFGIDEGSQTDPAVALDSGANDALRYCIVYSGQLDVATLVPFAGMTALHDHDYGSQTIKVDRQTTIGSGSFTIGYTAASDDCAMTALAIRAA